MDQLLVETLAEVAGCRRIVEEYTQRIDEACVEYYTKGKSEFPTLSRTEDEVVYQQCYATIVIVESVLPGTMQEWEAIEYPRDQYDEQIERMRDVWIRQRNLLRKVETILRTKLELAKSTSPARRSGQTKGQEPDMIGPGGDIHIPPTERDIMIALRDNIVSSFDENELRDLCFIKGIDYESLVGTGKSGKARELVTYCYRRGMMHDLVESCRALRPNVHWPDTL